MGVTADGIPFPEYTDAPDGPKQMAAISNWLDAYLVAGGNSAWVSWSPTVSQGSGVTVTNNRSRYMQVGKLVIARFKLTAGSSGTASNTISVSTPVPAADAEDITGGNIRVFDVTANINYVGMVYPVDTTHFTGATSGFSSVMGLTNPSVALGSGDIISGLLIMEAA